MSEKMFSEEQLEQLRSFPEISSDELIRYFTPTAADVAFVDPGRGRGPVDRLGMLVQLCTLPWLGFVPDEVAAAPAAAVARLAERLGVGPAALKLYGQRAQTRSDHLAEIATYLGWKSAPAGSTAMKELEQFLLDRAMEHDAPTLLFNLAREYLMAAKVIRPGALVLAKMVGTARRAASDLTSQLVGHLLTEEVRADLERMLAVDATLAMTRLEWLTHPAKDASAAAVKTAIDKLAWLRGIDAHRIDVSVKPPTAAWSASPPTRPRPWPRARLSCTPPWPSWRARWPARRPMRSARCAWMTTISWWCRRCRPRTCPPRPGSPFAPIASLLVELDARTHFLDCFTHAGGRKLITSMETKRNILAVLIALATNLGLSRMSEACGVSYDVLAWTLEWYIREETLRESNTVIVNHHYQLPLSKVFGGATMSSSDGQRFPLRGKSLTGRHMLIHGGQVLSTYTHVSDQWSTYGTKVIVPTAREAHYVLDDFLGNATDLPIDEHATDSHGATCCGWPGR
ncbi:Tn3 family transposase [Nonomuraea gerenzanensis]|uniref:Probable transposase n=1 Tax=Nonomuraea gerenzanensis TaxID=93944 RepID=A0A1M4ECL1_9ACTN|nr:Tn3 family transposase [Nonomuraea gerenzanensis]UBU18658.1 Tn3 family transposase [Nonomuraea gerenzanensis]SBO96514.1 probable transposase [Nonomuraea gerenzanensis]